MDDFFRFSCPNPVCGVRLKARPDQAGCRTRCPRCNGSITPHPAPPPRRRAAAKAEPPPLVWVAGGVFAALLLAGLGGWFIFRLSDRTTAARPTEPAGMTSPPTAKANPDDWTASPVTTPTPLPPAVSPAPAGPTPTVTPEPQPVEKPATPARPTKPDLAAKLVGDWTAADGSGWEVSFTEKGAIILADPGGFQATFYSFDSADTITLPVPVSAVRGNDGVIKASVGGDELTLAFNRGPTVKFARAKPTPPAAEQVAKGKSEKSASPPPPDGVNPFNPSQPLARKDPADKPSEKPADTPKAEVGKLAGTWTLKEVRWAEANSRSTLLVSNDHRITICDGHLTERHEQSGEVTVTEYDLSLEASKLPAVFTQTALDGRSKGRVETGIYSLDGDTLRLCSKQKGLPTDFEIVQGKEVKDKYVYVYERVK